MSSGAIVGIVLGGLAVGFVLVCGGIMAFASDPKSSTPKAAQPVTTSVPTPIPATPTKAGPAVVQLGQALTFKSYSSEVVYILNPGPKLTKTKYGTGPDKGSYYALSAAIEVKKGSTYACGCDVALVAKDGTVYEPSAGFGFDGVLEAVTLNAGQKAAGVIVWDLPAAAVAGARIELRANVFADAGQGYWQLP